MKIPHVSSKVDENVIDSLASANDIRNKKKAKDYVDKKKRAQYSTINVGDYVLLQQDKTGKLSTNFDHRPYKVTHKEGCIGYVYTGPAEYLVDHILGQLSSSPKKRSLWHCVYTGPVSQVHDMRNAHCLSFNRVCKRDQYGCQRERR